MRRVNRVLLTALLICCCGVVLLQLVPISIPESPPHTKINTTSIFAFCSSLLTSWFVCWLIVRYEDLHSHFSADHVDGGPQKFHTILTPRIGGLALAAGLLAGEAVLLALLPRIGLRSQGYLLLAALPAFLGGLIEDVSKRVGVAERLLATMLSAAIASLLLDTRLTSIDLPVVDTAFAWPPLSLLVTLIAVGGVANSINIIDGYNGVAAGVGVVALAALILVAQLEGDFMVLSMGLATLGACLGFLLWNWPKGKLFLGDGGAYLLGFLLAELSLLLVIHRPSVSPWFPLVLLIHPVAETLFSIYRRKVVHCKPTGQPDAHHLHQLIYKRLVRIPSQGSDDGKLRKNNRVAPYIWGPVALMNVLAVVFYSNTPMLIGLAIAYCFFYWMSYRMIVNWRTPALLISRGLRN